MVEHGDVQQGYQNGVAPEGYMATPEARARSRSEGGGPDLAALTRDLPAVIRRADEALVAMVRERPIVALGLALGVGYLAGRALRRWF